MVDCQGILTAYKGKFLQLQFYEDSSDRGCGIERKTLNKFSLSLFNVYMFNIYGKYAYSLTDYRYRRVSLVICFSLGVIVL